MEKIKITKIEEKILNDMDDLRLKYHEIGKMYYDNKKNITNITKILLIIIDALKKAKILETNKDPNFIKIHNRLLNDDINLVNEKVE